VQYREKGKTTRDMVEEAIRLVALTRRAKVPLVINDRLDVALAVGADGVHVGTEDMPVAIARRLMGPDAIVGATVDGPDQARAAERDGADYVAIGPIFPSPTKPECMAVGIQAIAEVADAVALPVCAIGGITTHNVALLGEQPAALVAVISGITAADDPRAAAQAMNDILGPP